MHSRRVGLVVGGTFTGLWAPAQLLWAHLMHTTQLDFQKLQHSVHGVAFGCIGP